MRTRILRCPYCNYEADLVDSKKVYGKSFGLIYLCRNYPECDAFVGVHQGTQNPLGTMANSTLRRLRILCHELFDAKWKNESKENGKAKRIELYKNLAKIMNITGKKAHFGNFDEAQCRKFLQIKEFL